MRVRWRRWTAAVRAVPPVQLGLRAVLAGTGGAALLLAPAGQLVAAGLLALTAVPALLAAVVRPDGGGPAAVLGLAVAAWALRYGVAAAPLGSAAVLAGLLYLHHLTAALCAALPPTAVPHRTVLARWGAHAALVLVLTGGLAAGLGLLGRPGASAPLELLGIAAAVGLAAVPVLLAHRD
jgi:hypothetical protein